MNIDQFENTLRLNYPSKKTIESYRKQISPFLKFCDHEITQEKINNYILNRRENVSISSLNLFLNALKKYLEYNKLEFTLPKQKGSKAKQKPYLTVKELESILEYSSQIIKDYENADIMLQFLFWTGLRPQELLNLKITDIDFIKKMVIVKNGKGDKDRVVPFLNTKFFNTFQLYAKQKKDYLFNYNKSQLNYIMSKIEEGMSFGFHITTYTLRRSFAKNCIKMGIDVYTLMKLMGHNDISMTLRYVQPDEKMIMEICEKMRNQ